LVSVLQNRPGDCEVLVLHTQAYDDPYSLSHEVQFIGCGRAASLVQLINAGIEASQASIIHVLAAGLEAEEGWADAALPHFHDDEVAAVVPVVRGADRSRLVSAGLRISAAGGRCVLSDKRLTLDRFVHLRTAVAGPTLAAGFYRRGVLKALGGLDTAAGDRLADADLALALADLALQAALAPQSQVVQVADPLAATRDGTFAHGRAAQRLFSRSAARVGLPLALAALPLTIASEVLGGLPSLSGLWSLVGRAIGLLDAGGMKRHLQRIAHAKSLLAEHQESEQVRLLLAARRPGQEARSRLSRRAA
jgi:hypothetical protein